MNKIILHHTAGGYYPNNIDLKAYHFCIDKDGSVHEGKHIPEDNLNCNDGIYAAHTYKGNTRSIGIAACCNRYFNLIDKKTPNPITKIQFEAMCKLAATMCKKYKININNVYTHYGFDLIRNIKQGKIDITYLPFKPDLKPIEVENYFRNKIKWYLSKM